MKTGFGLLFLCVAILFYDARSALALRCDAKAPAFTQQSVVAILKRDGISIPILRQGKLNRLGNIKIGATCYTIYTYEAEFQAASNTHYTARVFVLRERKYIGMYNVDELPVEINGNTIKFPGPKIFEKPKREGNEIIFDENGPPQEVLVQGEFRSFFK
jgi:hypothetical protein